MKNFKKVLSKTVASVYTAHTPSRGVTRDVIKGLNPL